MHLLGLAPAGYLAAQEVALRDQVGRWGEYERQNMATESEAEIAKAPSGTRIPATR
jgi:hypothetical protein